MMRDVPYILGIAGFIIAFAILGTYMFFTNAEEDSAVTALNNLTRNAAIQHVDMVSRVDIGQVYLNQNGTADVVADPDAPIESDFETNVLKLIQKDAPDGSQVRFDYISQEETSDIPVTIYTWENGKWNVELDGTGSNWRPLTKREAIEAIRVQYREAGNTANKETNNLNDPDYWSYQSTIEVDRSDFVEEIMAAE